MPPEVIRDEVPYSKKADVYAVGVGIYEIASRKVYLEGMEPYEVCQAIISDTVHPDSLDSEKFSERF